MYRDGGDCSGAFLNAGIDALAECNRTECPCVHQDYDVMNCWSGCFNASCDWSRSSCTNEHASMGSCPIIDAAVFESIRRVQSRESLMFVKGGTAR